MEKILKIIRFGYEKEAIPFAVFKPSGFGRFALYQKITEKRRINSSRKTEWIRVKERFHTYVLLPMEKNVPLLIDAEESWMQDAADDLLEKLMETYNKEKAIVFNTLQMYRHDRMDYLKDSMNARIKKAFILG